MLEFLVGLVAVLLLLLLREIKGVHRTVEDAITNGPGNAVYQINSGIASLAGFEHLTSKPDPIGAVWRLSEQIQETNDRLTIIESKMPVSSKRRYSDLDLD